MSTVTTVSDDTSVIACGKPNSHVVSKEVDLSFHIQAEAFMLHSVASCYFTVRPSIYAISYLHVSKYTMSQWCALQ